MTDDSTTNPDMTPEKMEQVVDELVRAMTPAPEPSKSDATDLWMDVSGSMSTALRERRKDEKHFMQVGPPELPDARAADWTPPSGTPTPGMRVTGGGEADIHPDRHDEEVSQTDRVDVAINLLNLLQGLVSTIRDDEDNARRSGGLGFAERGLDEADEYLNDYRDEIEGESDV